MTTREIVDMFKEMYDADVSPALISKVTDAVKEQVAEWQTHIQLCIIHMVRNSLKYVARKDYKAVTSGLKAVYQAPAEASALMALDAFAEEWDDKSPQISKSCRAHWETSIRSSAIRLTSENLSTPRMPSNR